MQENEAQLDLSQIPDPYESGRPHDAARLVAYRIIDGQEIQSFGRHNVDAQLIINRLSLVACLNSVNRGQIDFPTDRDPYTLFGPPDEKLKGACLSVMNGDPFNHETFDLLSHPDNTAHVQAVIERIRRGLAMEAY